MEMVEHISVVLIVGLVAVWHVLHFIELLFGGPEFLVGFIRRRRAADTREVLEELGVGEGLRRAIRAAPTRMRLEEAARYNDPEHRAVVYLGSCSRAGGVLVGASEARRFSYFADVMSESLREGRAEEAANIVVSYVRYAPNADCDVDYIVGIKDGTPLLAAAVASKLKKPLVLFRGAGRYKYDSPSRPDAALFDGVVEAHRTAVIVDDSTTGGRMVLDCVGALRSLECGVRQCWVLFEPLGKDARGKLAAKNVELLSVVKMDDDVVGRVLGRSGRSHSGRT